MNTCLWIAQALLAFVFMAAGSIKLIHPYRKLVERMGFLEDFPRGMVRMIGLLEILGAVGVIVPTLTGVMPDLACLAAVGLCLIMTGAAMSHQSRQEIAMTSVNAVLMILSLFVAFGRYALSPAQTKSIF